MSSVSLGTDRQITFLEWIFRPDSALDRWLRLGAVGLLLGKIAEEIPKHLGPSAQTTALVCFALAAILGVPALLDNVPPKDNRLRTPVLTLAIAYTWMGLLYFVKFIRHPEILEGFDALTDVIGTLFFAACWFQLTKCEQDPESRATDTASFVFACIICLIAASAKLGTDLTATANRVDQQAARLFLNISDGLVFLSLYCQTRRLFGPPDPVTHTIIMLFGVCQIAAHGRDCLSESRCSATTIQGIVAMTITWSLLLGKIAFATYVSYLYFNRRIGAGQAPTDAATR